MTYRLTEADVLSVYAVRYWDQGFNIVLVKGKKPLHEWERWQNERQSEYDFDVLPWKKADGFALISGSRLNNGLYLCAVDYDIKNVDEEAKELGKKILKKLPVTQIEETPSGGQHWIYYSRVKPKSVSAYHNECALELLGEGKLIIMAPSQGYKRLNDNMPTVVDSLEDLFLKALHSVGIKTKQQAKPAFWFNREDLAGKPYKKRHPPCIAKLLEGAQEGIRNESAIRLASYLVNFRRLKPKKAWDILVEWNSHNQPPLEEKELESIFESALKHNYVFGCNDSILSSQCTDKFECPIGLRTVEPAELIDHELESLKAIELHPLIDFHPKIGYSIGAFLQASEKYLLILDKNVKTVDKGEILIEEKFPQGISVKPLQSARMHKSWVEEILVLSRNLLKENQIENKGKNEVFEMILQKTLYYYYHSDKRWHTLISCFVIATYLHRLFSVFPILVFQGVRKSGKTTIGKVLKRLCWNPTGLQLGLRSAPLFRTVEDSRPTFFADLTKLNVKDPDIVDLFEVIEPDATVRRCVGEDNTPVDFYVYCPKVLMVRQSVPFSDKAIEIITEPAPKGSKYTERRHFISIDPEFKQIVSEVLRSILTNWRLVYSTYESLQQDNKLYGRRFELWRPFLAVCKVYAPNHYEDLLRLAYEDVERAEKGDVTSEVEDFLLAYILQTEEETQTYKLKDLTQKAQDTLGSSIVRTYHIVQSALKNLGIIKKKRQTSEGVKYQIDLEKANAIAKERGITSEQTSKQPLEKHEKIDAYVPHKLVALDKPVLERCFHCQRVEVLHYQLETRKGEWGLICQDCYALFSEILEKRRQGFE